MWEQGRLPRCRAPSVAVSVHCLQLPCVNNCGCAPFVEVVKGVRVTFCTIRLLV